MHKVGNTYVDVDTNRTYQCTATISISPTLINKIPIKSSVWKPLTYTGGDGQPANTIVLEDEEGNRVVAVLVDEEVDFTATPNDIREGKIAATDDGVTVGEKFIPSYVTSYGVKTVPKGRAITITNLIEDNLYDYTKLQAIVCLFNKNTANSVASEMVAIDNNVYEVQSNESISQITKNHDNKSIDFGIANDFGVPCVVRYITFKEVE